MKPNPSSIKTPRQEWVMIEILDLGDSGDHTSATNPGLVSCVTRGFQNEGVVWT